MADLKGVGSIDVVNSSVNNGRAAGGRLQTLVSGRGVSSSVYKAGGVFKGILNTDAS